MGDFLELNFDTSALQSQIARILKKKASVLDDVRVKNIAAERYKDAIEHYVPKDTGNLRESAEVRNGKVVYTAKSPRGHKYAYADEQYHTPRDPSVRHTPGTYDHWNKHLTTAEKTDLYETLAKDIVEAMNER